MLRVCQDPQSSGGHWIPELSYRWLRAAQPRPALCWGKAQASGAVARSAIFPAPRNDSFHTEKWMFP